MLAQNLDIFKATRMLLSMLLNNTRNVSREVKYLEWSDIRKKCHEALDMIYLINSEEDAAAAASLVRKYLFLMFGVQNRVRLLAESGYLATRFKTSVIEQIDECSRQGVLWKKYFVRKSQNQGVKTN